MKYPKNLLFLVLVLSVFACSAPSKTSKVGDALRHYVTSDYAQRGEGYDWTVVSLRSFDKDSAEVRIRSRADRKRPSRSFSGKGRYNASLDTITVYYKNTPIFFALRGDTLRVSSPDEVALRYFCSGGASLAGDYILLTEDLDSTQLVAPIQERIYHYPGSPISYKVAYDDTKVQISASGLSQEMKPIERALGTNKVDGIAIGDLNADTYPEIYVFLYSDSQEHRSSLMAYSPNKGHSLSEIYLPEVTADPKLSAGYVGYDKLEIVENTLCRRFPITGTDKYRQVQYKLVAGEATWVLAVDKILEF